MPKAKKKVKPAAARKQQPYPQKPPAVTKQYVDRVITAALRKQLHVAPPKAGQNVLRLFNKAVADPFDGPMVRGIAGGSNFHSTALVRRINTCTITLPSPGTTAGTYAPGTGFDLFIPAGATQDPWVSVAYIDGGSATKTWAAGTLTVAEFNRDTTTTIPVGSSVRVISSGVRITPLDSSNNTGGIIYHFWTPPLASAGGAGLPAVDRTLGSVQGGATEALSLVRVKTTNSTVFTNPTSASFVPAADVTSVTPATIASAKQWPDCGGTRLFLDLPATATKLLIQVAAVVEYYHDTHKQFARPSVVHGDGDAHTANVNAMLMTRGGNNTSVEKHGGHGGLERKLHQITGVVEAGGKLLMKGMETAYKGIKGARALRGAMSMGEAGMQLVALAA